MKYYSKDILSKARTKAPFPAGLRLSDHMRETGASEKGRIYEFVGTDTFGTEWNRRVRYEVDAGREEEPILYSPIYDVVEDAGLPKNISLQKIGPGGVVFEEVLEGGEVKFSSVASSEETVRIRHYAAGIEYSKDVVIFNELWSLPIAERAAGIAYNALLNHIHLNPILAYSYAAANQTAANTSGSTTIEDYMLTIEDAITNSKTDTTNPRRGPYVLLIPSSKMFIVEKALREVPQQGVSLSAPSALDMIRGVIAYDGWTGTRGAKTTTYSGVTSTKGYLISTQYRGMDFASYVKQSLSDAVMQEDISRFLTQAVWDTYFGVYANPLRSTEEITWP